MQNIMDKWHKFFAVAEFPLTYQDRDHTSLQLRTNPPSRGEPNPNVYFVTPGGYAYFKFIAVDKNDYRKGYKIKQGDRYISGFGSFKGNKNSNCLRTSNDENGAFIFIPEFTGRYTFYLKFLADQRLFITRPWDSYTGGYIGGRDAVLFATKNDTGWAAIQQVFKMPQWPFRILNMAYLPIGSHFNLSFQDKRLFAENGKLMWGSGNNESAIASFFALTPSSAHSCYIMSVGGKYIRMAGTDQQVSLVDNKTQATQLCPIENDEGELSLWHAESDHVLVIKNELPVFSLYEDTALIAPGWRIKEHAPHNFSTLVVNKRLSDTIYLKKIVAELNTNLLQKKGVTWNYSFDNSLSDDWLIATPESIYWNGGQFRMPVIEDGANDFNLKPCDEMHPRHPCVTLESSVKRPGSTPLRLQAGHSRAIYEGIYNTIIKGRKIVDVTGLLRENETPSGEFMAAVRNAITYLSYLPEARDVVIRILLGEPFGWFGDLGWGPLPGPYKNAPTLLQDLTRDIPSDTASRMKLYIVYSSGFLNLSPTWNHAKIVAIDGSDALVGGHNMWHSAYLRDNPVLDVSMKLKGHAAADAQQFADQLWSTQTSMGINWNEDAARYDASLGTKIKGISALPQARIFTQLFPESADAPFRREGEGIPVLSVGREEGNIIGLPASDKALLKLIDGATENIFISAQCFNYVAAEWYSNDSRWPAFFDALAQALIRNVEVKVFLSYHSATGSYKGDDPADVVARIRSRLTGKNQTEVYRILSKFQVRSLPPVSNWQLAASLPGISNHAKVILVDKKVFSIGSQNYYLSQPASMAEFTYIVEDEANGQQLYDSYFTALNAWALPSPEIPPPPSMVKVYQVNVNEIICRATSTEGFGLPFASEDQCYLKLDGRKVWPENKKYIEMKENDRQSLNISFRVKQTDNPKVLELYEWDLFSDDHMRDYIFDPNELKNISVGEHFTFGKKVDERSAYTLKYNFSVIEEEQ